MWDHYPRRFSVPNPESKSLVINPDSLPSSKEQRLSVYELARRREKSYFTTFVKLIHKYLENFLLLLRVPSKVIELERLMLAIPLLVFGAFKATFFAPPHYTFHRSVPEKDPEHLIVLVHGLNANPRRMNEFADLIKLRYDSEQVPALIHNAEANWGGIRSQFTTGDGILRGGSRLAQEVNDVLALNPSVKKVSFIGHSLGGLYIRAAIPLIFSKVTVEDENGKIECNVNEEYCSDLKTSLRDLQRHRIPIVSVCTPSGAKPYIFLTANTPHVGVRDYFPWWFEVIATLVHGIKFIPSITRPILRLIGKVMFGGILGVETEPCFPSEYSWFVTQGGYGSTVAELMYKDGTPADPMTREEGVAPLLARMASEDIFTRPLRCFKYRIACGVVAHDSIVPCCSQTLLPYIKAQFEVAEAGQEKRQAEDTILPLASHLIGVVDDDNEEDVTEWSAPSLCWDVQSRISASQLSFIQQPDIQDLEEENKFERDADVDALSFCSGEDSTTRLMRLAVSPKFAPAYDRPPSLNQRVVDRFRSSLSLMSQNGGQVDRFSVSPPAASLSRFSMSGEYHQRVEMRNFNDQNRLSGLQSPRSIDELQPYLTDSIQQTVSSPNMAVVNDGSGLPISNRRHSFFLPPSSFSVQPQVVKKKMSDMCGSHKKTKNCSEDCDETGHVYGAFAVDSIEFAAVDALRKNSGRWIHCLYEFGVRPWHRLSHNILPAARSWVQSAMLGLPGEGRDEQLSLVAAWPVREDEESFERHLRRTIGGSRGRGEASLVVSRREESNRHAISQYFERREEEKEESCSAARSVFSFKKAFSSTKMKSDGAKNSSQSATLISNLRKQINSVVKNASMNVEHLPQKGKRAFSHLHDALTTDTTTSDLKVETSNSTANNGKCQHKLIHGCSSPNQRSAAADDSKIRSRKPDPIIV